MFAFFISEQSTFGLDIHFVTQYFLVLILILLHSR